MLRQLRAAVVTQCHTGAWAEWKSLMYWPRMMGEITMKISCNLLKGHFPSRLLGGHHHWYYPALKTACMFSTLNPEILGNVKGRVLLVENPLEPFENPHIYAGQTMRDLTTIIQKWNTNIIRNSPILEKALPRVIPCWPFLKFLSACNRAAEASISLSACISYLLMTPQSETHLQSPSVPKSLTVSVSEIERFNKA